MNKQLQTFTNAVAASMVSLLIPSIAQAADFSIYGGSVNGSEGFYYYDDAGSLVSTRGYQSTNGPLPGTSFLAEYDFSTSGSDVLMKITLTNTTGIATALPGLTNTVNMSDATFGAGATVSTLTGYAFDLLDPSTLVGTTLSTPGSTLDALGADNISGLPQLDACVFSQNTCQSGGQPNGILAGETQMFELTLGPSPLTGGATLDDVVTAYLNAYAGLSDDVSTPGVKVRYQQVGTPGNNGGSDKIIANGPGVPPDDEGGGGEPNPNPREVPEPSSVLGLIFLTGALAVSRRLS
jgi:hypothetical protein